MKESICLPQKSLVLNVFRWMPCFFSLSIFSLLAHAQDDNLYIDQSTILNKLQTEAAKIIQQGDFLTPENATAELLNKRGTQISLKPLKKHEKILTPAQIAEQLKLSTVIFARVYKSSQSGLHRLGLASGYVIGEEGICVTNYHVIRNYSDKRNRNLSIQIMTSR